MRSSHQCQDRKQSAAQRGRIKFKIVATGVPSTTNCTITFNTERHPSPQIHFLALRLPSRICNAGDGLRQCSRDQYELALRLEGPASPIELITLSTKTLAELASVQKGIFSGGCPTLLIQITAERILLTIHQAD